MARRKRRREYRNTHARNQILRELLLPAGITTLVLLGAVILSASGFVNRGLELLERREAIQDLDYAKVAKDFELKLLSRNVQDYGLWTASYEFVRGNNPTYITEDIGKGLDNLELNILAVVGASQGNNLGPFLFTQVRLPGQATISALTGPLEQELRQTLNQWKQRHGRLLDQPMQGLISFGNLPLLIATHPITPTYERRAANGFILMGKVISKTQLQRWSETRHSTYSIESISDLAQSPALRSRVKSLLAAPGNMEMQARDSNTLVADELLKDILNRPIFILSSQSDRQILRLQSEGLFYLYLVMGAAGVAFCVVFVRLASRVVRYTLLRNHSQEVLRAQKEFAQTTLSSLHEGVIVTDEQQRIRSLNHTAERMTGWQQRSAYHRPLAEVYRTEPLESCPASRDANHQGASPLPGNRLLRHREGHSFAIDESIAPILFKDGQQRGQVIIFRNVEEIRTAAQRLAWMARHDLLTGLLNRCEFEKVLQAAIDESERRQVAYSLCYFDLDHFRSVNDSCGSEAGDQALIRISALIRSCIKQENAQIGRVGNDEFAILLYQASPAQTQQLAEQIRSLVRQFQFHYDGKQLSLDLSYGIVPIQGSVTASDVLSNADAACFTQRQGGALQQNSDQENLLQARREDLRWVLRIKQALQENRFVLYQQSIVPLRTTPDRPLLREVLIRMVDPEGRIVPASQFISVVNRHNLAGLIDRWVVERFFQWHCQNVAGDLADRGDPRACYYCLNLFPQTISDYGFESFLETQLQHYPINPQRICFEITESSEIPNLALAAQAIERLRRLGFRFALDDFGKGTSSFGYLKQLPVDYLKIDGYFIRDLLHNTLDETIVASLVQISRQMGIQTTAEYVNSDALAQRLMALGVDYAQGFYLAEPEPLVASAEAALLLGRDWRGISPIVPSTVGQGDDAS